MILLEYLNFHHLPNLHFLTVELNDHAILKTLCQGVETLPYTEMFPETETPLIFNHKESMLNRKLERLLNKAMR